MLKDFRFGARMLLKQPGFTIVAVLTLALGIGATSAVFSLIEGVLLSPPPYREPNRLVLVDSARTDNQTMESPRGWAPLQWMSWQKEAKSLESVAAYGWTFNFLVLDEGSESLQGMPVTKDYFEVMGLQPIHGTHLFRVGGTSGFGSGDHHRIRAVAAKIQRRSQHHWQAHAHEPRADAAHHHWRYACRSEVPANANGFQRTQLQRKCARAVLGSRRSQSGETEIDRMERGRTSAAGCLAGTGADGTERTH